MNKFFNKFILLIICSFALITTLAATKEKTVNLTVGESFIVNPWSEAGPTGAGYYCMSTSIVSISDNTAFTVTENSRTKTRYPISNGLGTTYTDGYYCSYKITALKTGTYTFSGRANYMCYEGTVLTNSAAIVKYTVIVSPVKVVTSISIPNNLELKIGESYTFSPVIYETGAKTTLTWKSSNTNVASIDANGKLVANGIGNTVITCSADNGVSAQCAVTVNPILASSIALSQNQAELLKGEKLQLTATITPNNATYKDISWSSSDESVATVDNNGIITATSPGTCKIFAIAKDGSNCKAECSISVLSNALYVEDAIAVPSGTLSLPIQLQNTSSITGLQFELQLPEGVSVSEDTNGKLKLNLSDRTSDHSILGSKLSNGNYQFIVFSATSAALTGNEGAIGYITLQIDAALALSDYNISLKEIELTTSNSIALHHKDITAKLTLKEAVPGDTNGDGKITITDAVSIVNYILERTPSVFITKSADVNNDGTISITDAVSIINEILNK